MFELMLEHSKATLAAIYQHAFNQQLQQGTLDKRVFYHYLAQDALYLNDFALALKQIATRPDSSPDVRQQFQSLADDTLQAENDLHTRYFPTAWQPGLFSLPPRQPVERIPVIAAYTQHLLHAAQHPRIEIAIAACLPCFWIYKELGVQMSQAERVPGNPYQDWIDTYSLPDFVTATQSLIHTINALCDSIHCPDQKNAILQIFQQSATFELQFFESALNVDEQMTAGYAASSV